MSAANPEPDGRPAVLIVGGGIAGASTAWHLARRDAGPVVLLEREPALGQHSSGLNAAILRTLTEDPELTRLARRSAAFLHTPPEGFSEVPLVDPCGLLLAAAPGDRAGLEALLAAGAGESRLVAGEELARLAPHWEARPEAAVHVPGEGRLDISALLAGFERGAREAGVAIRTRCAVEELLVEDGAVTGVRLAGGEELRAATTVLAAGGWAGRLGAAAGSRVRLRPTRRHLMVTAPDARVDPRWPVVWTQGPDAFYCRPESGGLLLCACDQETVDPDACHVDADVRERVAELTAHHLPALADAGAAHLWCGMRTLTRDGRFAVGPDPDLAGLFWVAGLGGHGMVCGPEVGRIAARLLAEGDAALADEPDAALLDPARLAGAGTYS